MNNNLLITIHKVRTQISVYGTNIHDRRIQINNVKMTGNNKPEWEQVKENYSKYLEESKGGTGISIGEVDTGYPLRDAILQDMSVSVMRPQTARDCLITGNNEMPRMDELPPDMLVKISAEMSNILQVAITQDHLDLWECTYNLLENNSGGDDEFISADIWFNMQKLFDLVLCSSSSVGNTRKEKVLSQTDFIAGYLAYPILEGLLKRLCSNDLMEDGTVKTSGKVYNLSDGSYYDSDDSCNSLTDILYHFETEIADEALSGELERHREYIAKFGGDNVNQNSAYGLIYRWRNSIVHGQNQADVQYGISLNIICMIVWHYFDANKRIAGDWSA
ncbi:hypothetical protein [Haloarcula argentinensis]|uniref:Apea-like HEPN domain-containing protein n=1 Tax=Haloarcula argentinensis TaxID=43776 RepID=A0A847UFM4_HALAR|nr:hypothetical protein [Haloarcula argentinensis]NLV12385.1 hypothetical protein [Haloarcula argentinensis]